MSYVIKAAIRNTQHPEYGKVTIDFPIPDEEYDHTIEQLEELGIGHALGQDCHITGLDSSYAVLSRLEGSAVNVDELDYLAKRLDSFVDSEAAQFQGMAAKLDTEGIQDFINLTFCCQQVTVITDFSNLERVGRDHFMNLNGGCATMEELEGLDGRETAFLLIDTGDGVVTPYGVVYDNGMKLEPLYDGHHFPAYYYEPPILALEVSTVQAGSTGTLCLPMPDQQLRRARLRSEADGQYSTLTVTENELPEEVSEALDLERLSGDDLPVLNRLCRAIKPLDELERKKLDAVVVMTETSGIVSICQLAENLEQFDFIPGIHSPEEYGKYMIQQSGHFECDENLVDIYADKGISGTSAEKREDFQRLIADCMRGRIDRVLVKSISRFARNTKDCLKVTRDLKTIGVSVFFEEQNIDTAMVSGEMMTAIFASLAQKGSESISKNMRMSYERRMRRGTFSTCKAPFGFRLVDGKLVIEESEAEIIRLIFRRYLDGNSHASIAEEVSTFGIPTRDGHERWQRRTIRYILENERYAGDSMLQKRFTTDALPYRQKWNHGEKTMYFVPESNPPIISKETFEKAQSLLKWKAKDVMTRCESPHDFTLAIVCNECGAFFKRKVTHQQKGHQEHRAAPQGPDPEPP